MPSLSFMALAAGPLLFQYAYTQCTTVESIDTTIYGYPDGGSDTTSFGCHGTTPYQSTLQTPGVAGGSGSYDDPFTLATLEGSTMLQECELVYIPYFQKYYRYADHCSGCANNHVDLWIGTDTNGGQPQINCELLIGTSPQTIVKNPPAGLPVNSQNLWDGSCHNTDVFANPDVSNVCSGSSGSSNPGPSSAAAGPPPPATTPAVQQQPTPTMQQQPTSAVAPPAGHPFGGPSSVAAPAFSGRPNYGEKAAVVRPNAVPTTLATIASAPVASDEPTGTPLPTKNGVCTTAGAAVCSSDGTQIGICNIDMTVVFMDVAPGTKCVDGGMVFANS